MNIGSTPERDNPALNPYAALVKLAKVVVAFESLPPDAPNDILNAFENWIAECEAVYQAAIFGEPMNFDPESGDD